MRTGVAVATVVLLTALAVVVALPGGAPPVAAPAIPPAPTGAPTGTATVPSPAATEAPRPAALPTPAPGALRITATPLRDAAGDWAFVVQRAFGGTPTEPELTDTIHAVRIPDGRSQLLATLRANVRQAALVNNALDEQLSPDRRQLVLSVVGPTAAGPDHASLAIIEIATGTVRRLTSDPRSHDVSPAWSPDGSSIAFVRTTIGGARPGGALWIMDVASARSEELLAAPPSPNSTVLYGWAAGSSGLAFTQGFEDADYRVLDLRTRVVRRFSGWVLPRSAADWRTGDPAFVGAFGGAKGGPQTIELASGAASPQRVLARDELPNTFYLAPQWRPGGDDIAFVVSASGEAAARSELRIVSASAGVPVRRVAVRAGRMHARWSPDGGSLVYLEAIGVSATLHLVKPDGSDDRPFFSIGGAPEARIVYPDLAVARLP